MLGVHHCEDGHGSSDLHTIQEDANEEEEEKEENKTVKTTLSTSSRFLKAGKRIVNDKKVHGMVTNMTNRVRQATRFDKMVKG